jgi:nanoRNase/pAp phosphatase (c-di-AMP/oligoRNAs hydrolase)
MNESDEKRSKTLESVDRILDGKEHLLVVVHNSPDPDAIASAVALGYLAEKRREIDVSIAFGGSVGRAENREMIRKLKIHMKQINRINFEKYDCIALVDTQPGAANNSFPNDRKAHIVIDHHPRRPHLKAAFDLVEPEIGATSTILIEWLRMSEIEIPADLATALAYAILSETQNLGREASRRDVEAYLSVYIKSNIRILAEITLPKLPRSYYLALAKTLERAYVYRNLIYAHIGDIPASEIVAEMADFLLRHERIGWSMCTGRFKEKLIISIRTMNPDAHADELIKSMVSDSNNVGGHEMIAGGFIPLQEGTNQEVMEIQVKLSREFAEKLGHPKAHWRSLFETAEGPPR